MSPKKTIAALALLLFMSTLASAQSLAEVTKKEKERRENLKGKSSTVVTNADLAKTKKKPSVTQTNPVPPAGGEAAAATAAPTAAQETGPGTDKAAADLRAEAQKKYEEKKAGLEDKWAKAKEMVDLLNLKMNALWQQFYSFNSMTPKDQIQKAISETYQKFQAAQAEEAKAKEELDKFLALGPKEKFLAAGIK